MPSVSARPAPLDLRRAFVSIRIAHGDLSSLTAARFQRLAAFLGMQLPYRREHEDGSLFTISLRRQPQNPSASSPSQADTGPISLSASAYDIAPWGHPAPSVPPGKRRIARTIWTRVCRVAASLTRDNCFNASAEFKPLKGLTSGDENSAN